MDIRPLCFYGGIMAVVSQSCCGAAKGTAEAEDRAVADSVIMVVADDDTSASGPYLISGNSAGPFRIGAPIPDKVDGFVVSESIEDKVDSAGMAIGVPVYIYEIGNEGWVKVTPQYDKQSGCVSDRIGEILVYSDLFLTDRGIGAMSSIEDFAAVYPEYQIRYDCPSGLFVMGAPGLKNIHFVIDGEYYQGEDSILTSDNSVDLQISDFSKKTCFTSILLFE